MRFTDPGEGIHEAEIVEILVQAGDEVQEGDGLLAVETDKATTELPSPYSGRIADIAVAVGDQVRVGDLLLTFEGNDNGDGDGREVEISVESPDSFEEAIRQGIEQASKSLRTLARLGLADDTLEIERDDEDTSFARDDDSRIGPDETPGLRAALEVMVLCNNANLADDGAVGDPTEVALLEAASAAGFELGLDTGQAVTIGFMTFGFGRLLHVLNMRGTD
jgi:pyruvate/2-oxoglutarate dehydrogenase complex dihydrolipoamide acyltransferase (E2) component